MSWFDTANLTNFAKSALKEAQKTIDKALDIQDEYDEVTEEIDKNKDGSSNKNDFFSSWGLTMSGESEKDDTIVEQPIITESPSKSNTVWGSFTGSFFEQSKGGGSLPVSPVDTRDFFNKSKLVIHSSPESETPLELKKDDEKYRINRLSIVSGTENSSESVEVIGSQKTTPDSESIQLISHSSSTSMKPNSESVEVLPESLISPSSIEFLGYDSNTSDKINEDTSKTTSPDDDWSPEKLSPSSLEPPDLVVKSGDSVSIVPNDDDDDTISYNSVSECTVPTVFDTEDKQPHTTLPKTILERTKELPDIHKQIFDAAVLNKNLDRVSEASSNDGSWSDRTLNADNDNTSLDTTLEETTKPKEDVLPQVEMAEGDKFSDTSSFCNLVKSDVASSDNASVSGYIAVDKETSSIDNGNKDRTSPISSESCSGLVKIGSDRTSNHTSGDELETATSSDIEIIPSPNGDKSYSAQSPAKYKKSDRSTSPNLVDYVLGKTFATKVRGHNRELSETSIQSIASDDSTSESEKILRRLCEMSELLEAREAKLIEMGRNNAELVEVNLQLKSQIESLNARHESGDINILTEDYTQRMSTIEKKFQQTLREKDALKKQLDSIKSEESSRQALLNMEESIKEKDEMISQLQEEGEKLAKQQLTHGNIIKKLRAKEKDNEAVIKNLRDKIAEQTQELDRLKRLLLAKEELEANQIEAIYKLTNTNKKYENELNETKSALDDITHMWNTSKIALDAARKELEELQRNNLNVKKKKEVLSTLEKKKDELENENQQLRGQLDNLRAKMIQEETKWAKRESSLRAELSEARGSMLDSGNDDISSHALLQQLHNLQHSAVERDKQHRQQTDRITKTFAETQSKLSKCVEAEKTLRNECKHLQESLNYSEESKQQLSARLSEMEIGCSQHMEKLKSTEDRLEYLNRVLEENECKYTQRIEELTNKLNQTEQLLNSERINYETEKKKTVILQEQLSRGVMEHSPPHSSAASDSLSNSFWQQDDGDVSSNIGGASVTAMGAVGSSVLALESLQALVSRREAELRSLSSNYNLIRREKDALTAEVASLTHQLNNLQSVREQYDELLILYGERVEQANELALDLQDVKDLYKSQLDEIISLKRQLANRSV